MRYEIILWFMWMLKSVPGKLGCALRRSFLPIDIGRGSTVWENVQIDYPRKLKIGARSSINRGAVLNCGGGIEIGDNVLIGPNVTVYSQNHIYENREMLIVDQGYDYAKVVVASDVWIASNVVILPGVTIAEGCVIGAASVVTKSTEPYGVYVGSPALMINTRLSPEGRLSTQAEGLLS